MPQHPGTRAAAALTGLIRGGRGRRLRRRLGGLRTAILTIIDTLEMPFLRIGAARRGAGIPSVAVFNLHGVGDLLLSLPSLTQIRERYPAGRYSLVLYCHPSAAELAARFAPVDQVVVIDRHRLLRSARYRLTTLRAVAAQGHAVAIQPTYNRMLAVEDALMRATAAGERIGSAGSPAFAGAMARRLGDRWYHRVVKSSPGSMHELDRYAEFHQTLGWPAPPRRLPSLALPEQAVGFPGDYVLFIPDSSSPLKSWPIDRFETLAHQLADLSAETFVFAGAYGAEAPGLRFRRWRPDRFVDLSGQTSAIEFVQLIKGAKVIITNDSAGLHFGAMLKRPVVAIAGGGLPNRYHPYPDWVGADLTIVETPLPCYGCNWNCIYDIKAGSPAPCIAAVEVARVREAARRKL